MRLFPLFQASAWASAKEQVYEFLMGCRSTLPADEVRPVVKYFLESENFEMTTSSVRMFHLIGKSVPEDYQIFYENFETAQFTAVKLVNLLSKIKTLSGSDKELMAIRKSCAVLFDFFIHPRTLPQEVIASVEVMQTNILEFIGQVDFNNHLAAEVACFILGFLLKADEVTDIKPEVAYSFVVVLASRVQFYFKHQSKTVEAV